LFNYIFAAKTERETFCLFVLYLHKIDANSNIIFADIIKHSIILMFKIIYLIKF